MSTASRTPLTSMAMTTHLRHTVALATINLKLHTQAATTSLLLQSIKPTLQQIRTLISRRVLITHTHSTTLQTTPLKARTRLTNKIEVHLGIVTLH
jgi:hypothetical protein